MSAARVIRVHGETIRADEHGAPIMPGHWHTGTVEWQDAWVVWWGRDNLDPRTVEICAEARARNWSDYEAKCRALGEFDEVTS